MSRLKQFKRGMFSEEEGSNGEFPAQTLLHEKGLEVVVEELKQRITAKANKVKRYYGRVTQ